MAAEIKPLTSIRGIAAVLVVIYHFHQTDTLPYVWLGNLLRHGYFWVDLFFVLSGFVMALTSAPQFAGRYQWSAHKDFLLKRLARVYPLYLALTLGVSLYSAVVYDDYDVVHRPAVHLDHPYLAHITNILMIQAWGFGSSIGGPTWSISTEWAAYLLFPLLVHLALNAGRAVATLLTVVAVIVLIYVATQVEVGQSVRNGQFDIYHCLDQLALLRCLGGFTVGLLAFRLTRVDWLMRVVGRDSVCMALFVGLLGLMAGAVDDLWIYPLLPLLVLALYGVRGWAARLFSAPPLHGLGVLSYSLYLLHTHFYVLLQQLQLRLPRLMPEAYAGWGATWVAAALTYAAVFAAAFCCYRWIEKPGRAWLRHHTR